MLDQPSSVYAWFERQYLAGQGLIVVEVWPRGSVGFGNTFRRQNYQDWGSGPMGDVLAVADSAAERGWVDTTRQALAGHGYGGTLTAWITAHSNRFRAAAAQNGIYDLSTLLARHRTEDLVRDQFGGYPWEDGRDVSSGLLTRDARPDSLSALAALSSPDTTTLSRNSTTSPYVALRRNSPINHAHRIHTPLLLIQGPASGPSPEISSVPMYRRLQTVGHPVEYARYLPPSTPAQRRDQLTRVYEFFSRFFSPKPSVSTDPSPK